MAWIFLDTDCFYSERHITLNTDYFFLESHITVFVDVIRKLSEGLFAFAGWCVSCEMHKWSYASSQDSVIRIVAKVQSAYRMGSIKCTSCVFSSIQTLKKNNKKNISFSPFLICSIQLREYQKDLAYRLHHRLSKFDRSVFLF